MKRVGGLYADIWDWNNLRRAFYCARRGTRRSREVLLFEKNLDLELRSLQRELRECRVVLGGFRQFVIHDPKERTIMAPSFRDRVLHHALIGVCEPHFERWLISDTFACRKGKGRLAALERATLFAKRHGWFLKLDVRRYFESISHENLNDALGRKFKDPGVLGLFQQIIHSHEATPRRGLPIGSLVSQHLANFYLGSLDRLVKETLRFSGFVRYMDDFVLWHQVANPLKAVWSDIEGFLETQLRLSLKPGTHLNRTVHGMDFCGFRIFRGWRTLNRRSRKRLSLRLGELDQLWASGAESELSLQARAQSVLAFAKEGSSWHARAGALSRASTA
jgi:RNA-directed DNA polymerase